MDWTFYLYLIGIVLLVAFIELRLQMTREEQPESSKIVIIDYGQIASSIQSLDKETQEKVILNSKRAVQRLGDSGFIVLDSKSIVTAPEQLYISTDQIINLNESPMEE